MREFKQSILPRLAADYSKYNQTALALNGTAHNQNEKLGFRLDCSTFVRVAHSYLCSLAAKYSGGRGSNVPRRLTGWARFTRTALPLTKQFTGLFCSAESKFCQKKVCHIWQTLNKHEDIKRESIKNVCYKLNFTSIGLIYFEMLRLVVA